MANYIEKLGWGMGKKAKVMYKQEQEKARLCKIVFNYPQIFCMSCSSGG